MDNTVKKEIEPSPVESPILETTVSIVEEIYQTIGLKKAESGGVLGGAKNSNQISHYHFDESSQNTCTTFTPDCSKLNRLFKTDWNPRGIRLAGVAHSHPGEMRRPSFGDRVYAERILKNIDDIKHISLPMEESL